MGAKLMKKIEPTKWSARFLIDFFTFLVLCLEDGLYCLQHALVLNQVEEHLNHGVQTIYLVEVFAPDELCAEYAVGNLLRIAGSP